MRARLTLNPKHGAALWLDGRCVARIEATVEDSRVSAEDPIPRWRKGAMVFVDAVNKQAAAPSVASTSLEDALRVAIKERDDARRETAEAREAVVWWLTAAERIVARILAQDWHGGLNPVLVEGDLVWEVQRVLVSLERQSETSFTCERHRDPPVPGETT